MVLYLLISDEDHFRHILSQQLIVLSLLKTILFFFCKAKNQVEHEGVQVQLEGVCDQNEDIMEEFVVQMLDLLFSISIFVILGLNESKRLTSGAKQSVGDKIEKVDANEHLVQPSDCDCLDRALNFAESNHKHDASQVKGTKVQHVIINILWVSEKLENLAKA